jgi:hypothetical protein
LEYTVSAFANQVVRYSCPFLRLLRPSVIESSRCRM